MGRLRDWAAGVAAIVASVVGLSVLLICLAAALADGETLRPFAERAATYASGRETRIGVLTLDRGRVIRVVAQDVAVSGPEGSDDGASRIGRLEVALRLASLLEARMDLPRVAVSDAAIALEAGGGQTVADAAPTRRRAFPSVRALSLREVALVRPTVDGESERLTIRTADGAAEGDAPVRLAGEALWRERPIRFAIGGGPFDDLVGRARYPFEARLEGGSELTVDGVLPEGGALAPERLTFSLSGPNLADIGALIGAPLPGTPPYTLSGDAAFEGAERLRLTGVEGRIGDSDARIDLLVDLSGARPRAEGTVVSSRLDFDDLAPLVGAAPDAEKAASPAQRKLAQSGALLPDVAPPVEALRAVDLDIRLTADAVNAPTAEVEALDMRFRLDDGRLEVRPLALRVAGGSAEGEIALNVRDATPSADVALTFENVDIKPYFADTALVQEIAGRFSGRLYVLGEGETLARMSTRARGGGHLIMRDGAVSGLAVEALGLDLVEALGLALFEDVAVPVHCLGAAFGVEGAAWRILQAAASTDDSTLLARGGVDMAARTIDVEAEARSRDFSLIDLNSPVRISGPLDDPSVSIADIDPLPFFELGDEEAPSCDAVIEGVRKAAPGRP
jgi:uncharacterized protein involved in outer membrane biogenesis